MTQGENIECFHGNNKLSFSDLQGSLDQTSTQAANIFINVACVLRTFAFLPFPLSSTVAMLDVKLTTKPSKREREQHSLSSSSQDLRFER